MSRSAPSSSRGELAVTSVDSRGRARKRSISPESASQRRSTGAGSEGVSTNVTCLRVPESSVKYSVSSRFSRGTSVAVTCVHMRSSSDSMSMSAVASRTSQSVLGRRFPVRWSSVLATQPLGEKWNGWPSSSSTSSCSVRPAMSTARGICAMAHSTSSRGSHATPVASSTWAPRSASSGSTREPAKRMPTSASSWMAWSASRLFSPSLSHVVVGLIAPVPLDSG